MKSALLTALVTLGLCFPIIAWETQLDIESRLTLVSWWNYVAAFVAIAFAGRFAYLMWRALPREQRQAIAPRAKLSADVKQRIAIVGLLLLIFFPFISIAAAGTAGSIKWIDNYGTQILIYILLAWGLNIVVGLAGLLDLGYVAFYAVGAYSSALLAKNFGVSFWLCLPLAGIFAALYGLMIGIPVLRLRGDYLAIVTLAFAEIVQRVAVNWDTVTGGYNGISGIPRPTLFGYSLSPGPDSLPALLGLAPSPLYRVIFLFYLVLVLALLVNWVATRLRRLPLGLRLGSAARGRNRLPVARHQHGDDEAIGVRDGRVLRRYCRTAVCRTPGHRLAVVVRVHGKRDDPGDRGAGRARQPAWRGDCRRRDDRRHGTAARTGLAEGRVRAGVRSRQVSHAHFRICDGAADGGAPTRLHHASRSLDHARRPADGELQA